MNKKITLYSTYSTTGCPRCKVLKTKLERAGVDFEVIEDFDIEFLASKGFKSAPVLAVDDEFMDMAKANEWINGVMENGN